MGGFEKIDLKGLHVRKALKAERDDDAAEVLMFIGRFSTGYTPTGIKTRKQVIECFTQGCCYWFARILAARFEEKGAEIVTDYTVGHFATKIRGHVYDITGDVTEGYKWERWDDCDDESLKNRITEYCIMF